MNKEKRVGVSLHADAARAVMEVQAEIERKVGFTPSLSQVIEFLVREYQKKSPQSTQTN